MSLSHITAPYIPITPLPRKLIITPLLFQTLRPPNNRVRVYNPTVIEDYEVDAAGNVFLEVAIVEMLLSDVAGLRVEAGFCCSFLEGDAPLLLFELAPIMDGEGIGSSDLGDAFS